MDGAILITPGQILGLCSAIIVISGAVTILINMLSKVTAPNKEQNARLDAIELRLKEHEELFAKDLRRFEGLEEGTRVTQRALLALLSHGIDGNDVNSLRTAKADLEKYLIER